MFKNSHTRRKRYVVPRELRVAVFVDPSMTRFFRQLGSSVISIENYLAKIMAIVAGIIRHPSLGQDITLKVVRQLFAKITVFKLYSS